VAVILLVAGLVLILVGVLEFKSIKRMSDLTLLGL